MRGIIFLIFVGGIVLGNSFGNPGPRGPKGIFLSDEETVGKWLRDNGMLKEIPKMDIPKKPDDDYLVFDDFKPKPLSPKPLSCTEDGAITFGYNDCNSKIIFDIPANTTWKLSEIVRRTEAKYSDSLHNLKGWLLRDFPLHNNIGKAEGYVDICCILFSIDSCTMTECRKEIIKESDRQKLENLYAMIHPKVFGNKE